MDFKEFKKIIEDLQQLKKIIPNTEKYLKLIREIDKEIQTCSLILNITKDQSDAFFDKIEKQQVKIIKDKKNILDITNIYDNMYNYEFNLIFKNIPDSKMYIFFKKTMINIVKEKQEQKKLESKERLEREREDKKREDKEREREEKEREEKERKELELREREDKEREKVESEKDNLTTETQKLIKNKFSTDQQKILNEFYEICKKNEFNALIFELLDEFTIFSGEQSQSLFFTKLNFFNSQENEYKTILNKNLFQDAVKRNLYSDLLDLLEFQSFLEYQIKNCSII